MTTPNHNPPTTKLSRSLTDDHLSFSILIALLLLRLIYLGGGRLLTQPDTPTWLLPSEMVLTYLLTSILIYRQRDYLKGYHITRLSLFLFLAAPFNEIMVILLTNERVHWPYGNLFRIGSLIIACVLVLLLWRSRREVDSSPDRFPWVILGLVVGTVLAVAYGWYFEYESFGDIMVKDVIRKPPATLTDLVSMLSTQFINASVMEEPLFRGFFWGYLRQRGLNNLQILLVQGGLFWLAHIYYLGRVAFSFWVLIPSVGLIFGWLAWRSRSIAPSLLAHTLINALTPLISGRTLYFWW